MIRSIGWVFVGAAAVAATGYGSYAGITWLRYGDVGARKAAESDPLLDRFMPAFEVVERHHIRVAAPAEHTFAAALAMDLEASAVIRAIFKARTWFMGGETAVARDRANGFVGEMGSLGWGVLAEIPGREIVFGAVTQPWQADPVFRALPPEEFAAFAGPGQVKIVFTLRVDPTGPGQSVFVTETRALATDANARAKFRRYWAFVAPGVSLIRWMTLGPLEADAERRATQAAAGTDDGT